MVDSDDTVRMQIEEEEQARMSVSDVVATLDMEGTGWGLRRLRST
jgi:hypothetical protein